jgi:hypothetical protein
VVKPVRQEQAQLPLRYRMTLVRARAQVNLMRDRRAHLRDLRSRLAKTLSISRLLEYWYKTTHQHSDSRKLSRYGNESNGAQAPQHPASLA